jgi:hypothetical protein
MNPILRENLDILFEERHVLIIYFYLLAFLTPVAFGTLYTQSLGEQMWRGSGLLLKVCASTAMVLIVYFALRLANQEFAPERFKPLEQWLRDGRQMVGVVARGRLAALVVHISCLTLLSAPLLAWAAAISHTPLNGLVLTLALIPFYALCYGVWGLVTSVLWQGETASREFLVRLLVLIVVVAALAVYLPLNPVIYLWTILGREEAAPFGVAGFTWPAGTLHFAFHLVLGGSGLLAHRWLLKHSLNLGHR